MSAMLNLLSPHSGVVDIILMCFGPTSSVDKLLMLEHLRDFTLRPKLQTGKLVQTQAREDATIIPMEMDFALMWEIADANAGYGVTKNFGSSVFAREISATDLIHYLKDIATECGRRQTDFCATGCNLPLYSIMRGCIRH